MTDPSRPDRPRRNLWSQAAAAAARTPGSRNRYVDFLRALSILAVISGHWLVVAPFVENGELTPSTLLEHEHWSQWLTWVFQVMPVFFFVGGYANGVSWRAALRDGRSYSDWLNVRLQRLIGPVLPLVVVWAVLGIVGHQMGVSRETIAVGSKMGLIPIWFLAVYVMAVVLVPVTYAAWRRFGLASFWALALAAVVDDVLFFAADLPAVGWLNYAFIWAAVHQLGYAWRDGQFAGPRKTIPWALGGLALLIGLVTIGPHPLSMVSVPGESVSNTLPPKLPMLALGIAQIGLLLSLQAPLGRWLARAVPWTATVLVNGMIMTIYLWHVTASTLLVGLASLMGNVGLTIEPGSGLWWAARPAWMVVDALVLTLFAILFGRFERSRTGAKPIASWRLVSGAVLVCGGLALLALRGIGGDGWLGLNIWVVLLPFAGAALAGVNPLARAPVHATR